MRVRESSELAGRDRSPTSSSRWRSACASSPSGAGKEWIIDPDGDEVMLPDDVLILRGPPDGIAEAARACRRARMAATDRR